MNPVETRQSQSSLFCKRHHSQNRKWCNPVHKLPIWPMIVMYLQLPQTNVPQMFFCPNNKQELSGVSIHRRYWQTQTESAALLFNLHGKSDKTSVMCVTQTRRLKSRLQKPEWPAPLKTDLPCGGCLIIKTWQQKGCGERERDSLAIPMSLSLESLTANHKTHSLGHRHSSSSLN